MTLLDRTSFPGCALCAFIATTAAGFAYGAEPAYPTRPIRLVIPFAPGGGLDVLARIVSPKLTESMGQTWVVDNRPGAAGNLGAELVARANPDGHTLTMALSTTLTVNPSLYKLPFSMEKDLQPITLLALGEHIVVVYPKVPAKTLKELVELAKQKPGSLNFASAGVGSSLHMAAELFKVRAGIDMVHVAYKGGGPAAAAVLAGESQVLVGTVASAIGFINAGRLRALAAAGAKRSQVLPELPTVAESGYPGYDGDAWYGLFAPGGTPRVLVDRIRSEMLKALAYPDVQSAMGRQGQALETSTPEALAARIRSETSVWAGVIKDTGIRAE